MGLSTRVISKRLPQGSFPCTQLLGPWRGGRVGSRPGTRDRGYGVGYSVSFFYVHGHLFHHTGVRFLACGKNSMWNGLPSQSHTDFTRTTGLKRVLVNSRSVPLVLQTSCLEANWYLLAKPSAHTGVGTLTDHVDLTVVLVLMVSSGILSPLYIFLYVCDL